MQRDPSCGEDPASPVLVTHFISAHFKKSLATS
jgi:hypothetical protein